MKVKICLVCLKEFDEELLSPEDCSDGPPLLTKFLKFVNNYLQVSQVPSSELVLMSGGGSEAFCEKCELAVINPICQVYSQLLSTQLRLSWELEQLRKLLQNSQNPLTRENDFLLQKFRRSLIEKCHQKTKEMLPEILIQRLMKIPVLTPELNHNQNEANVKLETDSRFENPHDDDDDDFNPLDEDTSHSLQSEGHPDEQHTFSTVTSPDNRDDEIDVEHNSVKIEIDNEPPRFLLKSDDIEEAIDPTYCPDSPPAAVKQPMKRLQVSDKRQFPCPKCPKIFPTHEKIKAHGYHVHMGKRFRCLQCKSCFKFKSRLEEHFSTIHNPQPQTCQHCGKVCKNKRAFKMHLFWFHSRQPPHKCPKCRRSFKRNHNMKKHLPICSGVKWGTIAPPKIKIGVIKKPFLCNDCKETFPSEHLLEEHTAAVHVQKVAIAFGQVTKMFLKQKLKK